MKLTPILASLAALSLTACGGTTLPTLLANSADDTIFSLEDDNEGGQIGVVTYGGTADYSSEDNVISHDRRTITLVSNGTDRPDIVIDGKTFSYQDSGPTPLGFGFFYQSEDKTIAQLILPNGDFQGLYKGPDYHIPFIISLSNEDGEDNHAGGQSFGFVTPDENLPTEMVAAYSLGINGIGTAGLMAEPGLFYGEGLMLANFETGKLDGSFGVEFENFGLVAQPTAQTRTAAVDTPSYFEFEFSGDMTGASFEAALFQLGDEALNPDNLLGGHFFGPQAQEVGGGLAYLGDDVEIIGTFAGTVID